MTNGEWLNSLSDEEFNKGIDHICDEMRKAGECDMHQSCDSCIWDWLKKERVEE